MPLTVIASERFAEHVTPPGHPEGPERAAVLDAVADDCRRRGVEVAPPRPATRDELVRVHSAGYLDRIASTLGHAVALDPDTFTSPGSHEIALLAAGAAVEGVERAMAGTGCRALALVRPPGHHAERDRAMGFCLYNNVAAAAAHARALGADRVAIVDYDVHHGNGTQHTFERDPAVLYVSIHQYPYYPGTGEASEVGLDAGTGFTVNLPLEAGAVDEDYRLVFSEIVLPMVRQFEPDLMLVSAGFDAHEHDPLGGMRLTSAAFAAMTAELRLVADACCNGRLVAVVEGGYDLRALEESLAVVCRVLAPDGAPSPEWPTGSSVRPSRAQATIARVRRYHRGA